MGNEQKKTQQKTRPTRMRRYDRYPWGLSCGRQDDCSKFDAVVDWGSTENLKGIDVFM